MPDACFDPRTLLGVLRDEDFHFHLRGRRGAAAEMFQPAPDHDAILAERRGWLEREPEKYAAWTPGAEALLGDAIGCLGPAGQVGNLTYAAMMAFAQTWEADFVLLAADAGGERFRVAGGVVCFPTNWDFPPIVGHLVSEVHDVVPGLNAALGPKIDALMSGLQPGAAWFRANWGLSRSNEMNQHPTRHLTRLDEAAGQPYEENFLRIERQMLWRLPRCGGVVFGIRPFHFPLAEILADPTQSANLRRLAATMPAAMREYKGF